MQLVWFKRDLRTHDHRPLWEAAVTGQPVLPLYVIEPDYWAQSDTSHRQFVGLSGALTELSDRLGQLGAPLILRTGSVVACLARIHRAVGIDRLLAHEETGNGWTFERDKAVHRFCREQGIAFVEYPQFGVTRRLRDRDAWGRHHAAFMRQAVVPEPTQLTPVAGATPQPIPDPASLGLRMDGCTTPQSGARVAGLQLLDSFFAGRGAAYRKAMSSPIGGEIACSRLSVSLATGALSIREVMQRAWRERTALTGMPPEVRPIPVTAIDSLVARLHWHCHFIQKLESEPTLETRSMHPLHEENRPQTDPEDPHLRAWAAGATGLPFVDACMRSLIATGWLNFRMRAMVQAIASYHLGLDWRQSGLILARLFTDYEPGIHWPQIQMQAGQTGINTPRIYNPIKQGADQDPDGAFTRRWVPELALVPAAYLQQPWRMDLDLQRASHCVLGQHYPTPIVDPETAAREAQARLTQVRHMPGYRRLAQEVFLRHGSRKRRPASDNPPKERALQAQKAAKASRQLALDL